ncbi:unnamed protein product [Schistosoma margrebowiei]|uniref:Cation efflux protein transmembrane domain-containing protein n=1 Tax=Schistosoma margrebowiei TaxID=48269 RepID=A0A183MGF2_9TREM|nr:unnamed protein product [Schistosoma margrebowiei]
MDHSIVSLSLKILFEGFIQTNTYQKGFSEYYNNLSSGALAHSLAIMTDAAHLLTDFASFLISLLALYLASRPSTKRMSFGWHRAEVVGALASVLLIWLVTGILVYLAVIRIIHNNYEINGKIMLITSATGVGVNIIIGRRPVFFNPLFVLILPFQFYPIVVHSSYICLPFSVYSVLSSTFTLLVLRIPSNCLLCDTIECFPQCVSDPLPALSPDSFLHWNLVHSLLQ